MLRMLNETRGSHAQMHYLALTPTKFHKPDEHWWDSMSFADNMNNAMLYARANGIHTTARVICGIKWIQAHISEQIADMTLSSDIASTIAFRLHRFLPK